MCPPTGVRVCIRVYLDLSQFYRICRTRCTNLYPSNDQPSRSGHDMPPSKKHKSSALGEALVSAALEGARKKRRLHEYELHELPRRIENEWKVEKDTTP